MTRRDHPEPEPRPPKPGETPRFCPACGGGLELRLIKAGEPERLVCGSCGRVEYLDPKVAACIVPEREGRILLLRRGINPGRGKWVMPGGFIDRGELPAEAAVREAAEEVGLDVEAGPLIGVFGTHQSPIIIVYGATEVRGEAEPLDETLSVCWFAPEEIPWADLAFDSTRQALTALAQQRGWPHPALPKSAQP
jgi:ADP-ribose pyrophosphatase YjhB (NUDIX family)